MNIYKLLAEKGFETVTADYYNMQKVWKSWYTGNVADFHRYKVYNGQNYVKCRRYTLGMAKKVCEDWANLLMNEKVHITLEGEKEQAFFDAICTANEFAVKANEAQEMKAALGCAAYVFRVVGADVNSETNTLGKARDIKIEYIAGDRVFPLSWENGRAKECAFLSVKTHDGKQYLYLQIHRLDGAGNYVIENSLHEYKNGNLSTDIQLATIPELENVPAIVETASDKPLFILDRLNIANNVDMDYPIGVSVFANAIDELKGTDIAYDSYVNEFVLGKKRIMAKTEALKSIDGDPAFDANDVVFYALPEDSNSDTIIKEIDMQLRTQEHSTGIQDMLNALSAKCGFGENHYRFNAGNITTATQIVAENSTLFRTIKKHEIILESVLMEFARTILRLGNEYMGAGLDESVEISIDFDDSIIEDKESEFNRDARMVAMGVMNAWEFRAKWMNEDEETARAALPSMESLVNDPNG